MNTNFLDFDFLWVAWGLESTAVWGTDVVSNDHYYGRIPNMEFHRIWQN